MIATATQATGHPAGIPSGWMAAPDRNLDEDGPADLPYDGLPAGFTDRPFLAHLAAIAGQRPDRIAVEAGRTRLAHADFLAAAERLGQAIDGLVAPGSAVGILLPYGALQPLAMAACLAAGRPFVFLEAKGPPERTARILALGRVAAVIVQGFGTGRPAGVPEGVRMIDAAIGTDPDAPHPCPGRPLPDVDVDAPAAILYTSGSTGEPKGIVNGQRALLQRVLQQVQANHAGPDDAFLPLSPPGTIAGTRECLAALLSGARLCLADPGTTGLPGLCGLIRSRRVTVLYAVPALFRLLAEGADPEDLATLRVVRLGGDRVLWRDADLLRAKAPRCLLQLGYSATETTGAQWFVPPEATREGPCVPVGRMLPGLSYRIVGEDGAPVPEGEVGELHVAGPHVALGLWEDGRCARWEPAPDGVGQRHATGDMVRLLPDGLVEHVGRTDRQVKVNGLRVEPAELEGLLRTLPGVTDAAVVAPSSRGNAVLVAFVATDGADPEFVPMARARIRRTLPSALHPARIHVLGAIPRLPSYKLDVPGLLAIDRASLGVLPAYGKDPPAGGGAGGEDCIEAVAAAWDEVLGRVPARRAALAGTPWNAAGGDSLRLMQLHAVLERRMGWPIAPSALRAGMGIPEMGAAVASQRPGRPAVEDQRPEVFILPGVIGECPGLSSFMREAAGDVRFTCLGYPDWRLTPEPDLCIARLVDDAAARIEAASPKGRVRLAGYSLGGPVAAEVAARLAERGREIAFLGILDSCILGTPPDRRRSLARAWRRYRDGLDSPARMLARPWLRLVAARRGFAVLDGVPDRLPAGLRFAVETEIADLLRTRAYAAWVAEARKPRLPCRVTVFRSEETRPGVPRDMGWSALAERVEVIDVGGSHLAMLQGPHKDMVARLFAVEIEHSFAV